MCDLLELATKPASNYIFWIGAEVHVQEDWAEQLSKKLGRKPRLLSINAYHYHRGGADNVYLAHADAFERRGWDVCFQSMHHPENIPSRYSEFFSDEIDYAAQVSVFQRLRDAGRIIYSLESKAKMAALLDENDVDLAHVHSIYHHQSPSVLVELRRRGIPVVLTAHDLKLACPSYTMLNHTGVCERCKGGRLWNVVKYRCIKNSAAASALIMVESAFHKTFKLYKNYVDVVITPSNFYREKLIEWGWDRNKVVHVNNFVSSFGAVSPKPGRAILYLGRLSPEKGLHTLIEASALSGVPVEIAGRGPQEESLKELTAKLNAPVKFHGFLSGEQIPRAIDQARATVLPSEWYENGPMSAIESLFRGKPIIGANIGGIPELIREHQTGWLFQSGDKHSLSNVLQTVSGLKDDDLMSMAAQCIEFAKSAYSEAGYFSRVAEIYSPLLERRKRFGYL